MASHKGKDGHRPGFAYFFYISEAWRSCREGYIRSRGGLCERCAAEGRIEPATQVHHKIRLTPDNLRDPAIALNWKNLEALCDACHQKEHARAIEWRTDPYGRVEI